jgi:hypothetical protein
MEIYNNIIYGGNKIDELKNGLYVSLVIIVILIFIYYYYIKKDYHHCEILIYSCALGFLRGLITGSILSGLETGIVNALALAIINPFISHVDHKYIDTKRI